MINLSLSESEVAALSCALSKATEAVKTITIDQLWHHFFYDHAKPHTKTWRNSERCYNSYFQIFKDRDCRSLTRLEVQQWHTTLGENVGWTTANRSVQLLCAIFNKCIEWELIPDKNPASKIRKAKLQSRSRYLQPEEVARFFAATATLRYETTRDFFHMLLFTGQRMGNVRTMKWEDIDFALKIWNIPMTKNGTPHKLPLPPEAMAILTRRFESKKCDYVFPGSPTTKKIVGSEPLGRNGCIDAWVQVTKRAQLKDFRIHDLRRTHATYQAINGANIFVIAQTLNHKDLNSTAIYARMHLDPVRKAMNTAISDICARAGLKKLEEDDDSTDLQNRLAPAMPSLDDLVDTKEAAEITGESESYLVNLRFRNEGPPFIKMGYSVKYSRSMLLAWSYGRTVQRLKEELAAHDEAKSKERVLRLVSDFSSKEAIQDQEVAFPIDQLFNDWISTWEAAKLLNLSRARLSYLRWNGKGPPYIIEHRQVKYSKTALLEWSRMPRKAGRKPKPATEELAI